MAVMQLATEQQRELTPSEMATVRSQRADANETFETELARRRAEGA